MASLDYYIYVMITNDLSLSHGFKHLFIVVGSSFYWIGLEKMKFCFRICGEIVSPSDFVIVAWTHAYSFPRLMIFYFELVELSMNRRNIVEKVIRRTSLLKIGLRGSESPLTL